MNDTKYFKVEQESSDSSELGSQDHALSGDESGRLMSQQPRSVAARLSHIVKRSWWLVGPFLWLLSLLFTWIIASAASKSPYDVAVGLETELEPIKPHIEMYTTTFSSDLDWDENGQLQRVSRPGSKQFVGDPSPEIDANWEHITNGVVVDLKGEAAETVIGKTYQKPDGSWYVGIEAFHQLHCLNMVRKSLHVDYYGINEPDPHPHKMHIEHCIDALREAIMCRAELTFIPMEFNAKYRTGRPAFVAREHTCRNFEKILDWAHQYPSNETLFVLPDGTMGDGTMHFDGDIGHGFRGGSKTTHAN
ncbi:Oxidase ustYa [Colletotrichum sidae]|uniref:Oxidase ustYa n=1 Tax=Colletotrichum sidae TaxID=1347389 RepID=A0A4R8SV19_9PEZI|nr:Oxidase ustYa [Colletotrichum sidae]